MSTELVTAHAGKSHVGSADIGALYAGAFGSGRYALDVGEGLAVSMTDSNTLHIGTGGFIFDGRWVRVTGTGEDVKIASGTQASYRKDLVVYTYTRDPSSSNIESGAWSVVQGTAASSESGAVVPEITEGSILDGDLAASVAVAEVDLAGLTPTAKLLLPCVSPLSGLRDSVSRLEAAQAPGAWTYLYGSADGERVAVRTVGPLVEMDWSFTQQTTNVWVLGGLPKAMRPAVGFVAPAVSAASGGAPTNNVATVEVWGDGSVHFQNLSGLAGGLNRGHCLWVAG